MAQCKTRDFGIVELSAGAVIEFTQPPFGFEAYTRYLLLTDPTLGTSFAWLQSVEKPELCFVLMDAACFGPSYRPQLPPKALQLVGCDCYQVWVVCALADALAQSTVNLRSPIVISDGKRRGMQVILNEDLPVRYPLSKGVAGTC